MSSVKHLREFIRERLTAAAEEIFTEVEKTIVRYEEDIKLLETYWKPQIKLTRVDLQNPHFSIEEKTSAIQQVYIHGMMSSHDQEEAGLQWTEDEQMEPEPPLIKQEEQDTEPPLIEDHWKIEPKGTREEEPEHPFIYEENEEPDYSLLKQEQQEPEHLPIGQEKKDLCSSQEGEQLVQKQIVAFMDTSNYQEGDLSREPKTDCISNVIESKDQEGSSFTVSESQPHTDTKKRSFKCDVCGKCFENHLNFKTHCRTHITERPFSCETCSKCFSHVGNLNVHKRVHTGEKPFSCQVCKKTFSQVCNLKVHMRIHTGEKPFSCQVCGKKFTQLSSLNTHKKVHTGERPFSCETCGKSFSQTSSLNVHKRIHTR
ncbi:zinc finger protein 3-like isoform X2 [Xiphophorus hellerii]|uniref:zinc finger protein 3-like isoform X2 n=1 Tax=Xiphophorus hellerii TaxID=8084 RepID=UPI0013B40482|nr:zinc finger protein 3-like isoform X2 [Xiphophorus hellerii]